MSFSDVVVLFGLVTRSECSNVEPPDVVLDTQTARGAAPAPRIIRGTVCNAAPTSYLSTCNLSTILAKQHDDSPSQVAEAFRACHGGLVSQSYLSTASHSHAQLEQLMPTVHLGNQTVQAHMACMAQSRAPLAPSAMLSTAFHHISNFSAFPCYPAPIALDFHESLALARMRPGGL